MEPNDPYIKELKKSRFLAIVLLIMAPIIYLFIAYTIEGRTPVAGEVELMFYMLLIIGICSPLLLPIVVNAQVKNYKKNPSAMTVPQLYTTSNIIKYAFVEATYIYGFVVYMLSGDFNKMLLFYPVGIVWTFVHWPKESSVEKFKQKLGAQ